MLEMRFDSGSLEKALQELAEKELAPVVKGLAQEVWSSILVKTPQMFGRLTASWSYSVNTPIVVDRSSMIISNEEADKAREEQGPFKYRGHPAAIRIAYSMNQGNASSFKLGDTIYFANGADHGEGPYSQAIEEADPQWLRRFNRPGAMVRRTAQAVQAKYENGFSEDQAERLKRYQLS